MPVAAPSQKEPQVPAHFRHLLPKPPGPGYPTSGPQHGQLSPSGVPQDSAGYVTDIGQYASSLPSNSAVDTQTPYFNPHSPPILNLSPNLSPTEAQRGSPVYDLRETARRRSLQDLHSSLNQQMPRSPQYYSGIIPEEHDRKSESPTRKRRKMSHGVIDLTNSPSPPPARPWETSIELSRQPSRRRSTTQQRRATADRCNSPRTRRSPPTTRRRTRDRSIPHTTESPERRAFQPPHDVGARQIHPAVLPQMQQHRPIVLDADHVQVTVSNPVTVPPYAVPVCSGTHHIPMCTGTHLPMCSTQPTWSLPTCNMPIPSCNIQHIPGRGLQQIPIAAHPGIPPTILPAHPAHHHPHHHHMAHHPHHPHHPQPHHLAAPPAQFIPAQHPPVQQQEEDLQILADHRTPHHYIPPALSHGHGPPLNTSPPVLLQEPTVHPTPQELYAPFTRYRRNTTTRNNRWRSIPPPPPPYPGFLLHFLAMLGSPPVPSFGMDFNQETGEVENYEALLNLAERLGEAKPRGLVKGDIDQLPSYRYNGEINRSSMDQSSCVVCMCDFENRQLLRVLPCSHEFHGKCVDKWLKTNRTCPICRADASEGLNQSE